MKANISPGLTLLLHALLSILTSLAPGLYADHIEGHKPIKITLILSEVLF